MVEQPRSPSLCRVRRSHHPVRSGGFREQRVAGHRPPLLVVSPADAFAGGISMRVFLLPLFIEQGSQLCSPASGGRHQVVAQYQYAGSALTMLPPGSNNRQTRDASAQQLHVLHGQLAAVQANRIPKIAFNAPYRRQFSVKPFASVKAPPSRSGIDLLVKSIPADAGAGWCVRFRPASPLLLGLLVGL